MPFQRAETPSETVDLGVLSELHLDVGRDADITRDVLDSYIRRAPELAGVIEEAARRGDRDGIRQGAHDLRSISGFVGAVSIGALAAELEDDASGLPLDQAIDLAVSARDRIPVVVAELKRFADSL